MIAHLLLEHPNIGAYYWPKLRSEWKREKKRDQDGARKEALQLVRSLWKAEWRQLSKFEQAVDAEDDQWEALFGDEMEQLVLAGREAKGNSHGGQAQISTPKKERLSTLKATRQAIKSLINKK